MPSPTKTPNFLLFQLPQGKKTITPKQVAVGSYKELQLLELTHLEKWISTYPALLGEDLLVVSTQFADFDKTQERLDILALDKSAKLVVVEIKRDESGRRQDLQALRYAAYCSGLSHNDIIELYQEHISRLTGKREKLESCRKKLDDFLENDLESIDADTQPRIILVSKTFHDEIAWTCLWLIDNFELDIKCVQLIPYKVDNQLLLASAVRIPLPGVEEYAISRNRKKKSLEKQVFQLDWATVHEVVKKIPKGYWMGYADVAVAAGGTRLAGMALGQYLARIDDNMGGAIHRVLKSDGTVSPEWRGDVGGAAECRQKLIKEGLKFDAHGRADPDRKYTLDAD